MICLDSFRGGKPGDAARPLWRTLAGRREAMDRAGGLMVGRVPQAVFVMAGPGIGKSLFLDAVTERLAGASIVERIHASPSLKHVPFGILAPFTSGLTGEEAASPVAVLRSVWLHFQRLKAGREWPVVLVVDDAHHLDESSAAILVDMVAAGWSSVMVAARPRPGLPQPLDQLWYDGLAERIDLHPLDRQQLAETLSAMLESPVPASLSGAFWVATEGNPLLVGCLLKDARTAGVLTKRNDLWQLAGPLPADGTELTAHVAREVARRSPEEQEALRIIALAGPVNRRSVEELCSADTVRELMDQHLVVDSGGHPSELSIRHPIMGEAIRRQVNVSRSLHLRQKLHQVPGLVVASEGGHLRHVEWALECGQAVEDADLLRAALIALRSHRSTSAVRLAGRIATGSQAPLARAVSARARFNMGDYSAARTLLEHAWTGLPDTDAVAAAMLRAAACMASGVLLEDVLATGADLPAGVDPSQGRVMELVSTVGPRALSDEPVCGVLEEAFLAEDLADRGQLHAALKHVVNAAAAAPTVDNTLFFFEEFVLFRAVCVYLGMGEWTAVERELGGYGDRHGGVPGIFEGTMETLRGYSCIRQGKVEQAVGILFPAVELLRQSDPLQLCRFSTSLAFYAAARLGDKAQARRLAADLKSVTHIDRPGTGLRATAYIHAGNELLERDGKGLAALREHVTRPEVSSRPAVVLECLLLGTELGEDTLMEAIHQAAAGMDGRWAEAVAGLASRWRGDDPAALLEEANSLVTAGFVNLARAAYQRAGALLHNADDARRFRQAVSLREKCDDLLGLKSRDGTTAQAPGIRLTRRERDIAELAAQGLSDKDIAQRLMVSVRTVEGHLYRTYVKLGVRSREELAPVLPRNAG